MIGQKVVRLPKAIEFFRANPVSFTPGFFSQVNCAKLRSGNRLKRFPLLQTLPITRLKPGVNENLDLPSCAKQISPQPPT